MTTHLASATTFTEAPPSAITVPNAPTAVLGMLGLAQRGPFVQTVSKSFDQWQAIYGNYTTNNQDAALAVKGFFDNGGQELHYVRVVHFTNPSDPTTKTSAPGTLTLQTPSAVASSGSVTAANTGPYALQAGQTLVVKIDGGGAQTFTFAAAAGSALAGSAGPYALTNGWTLLFAVDGGATQTVTFTTGEFAAIGAALASEVVSVLNAYFASNGIGALASVQANAVKITSNKQGSDSSVVVSGGTAAASFGFASTAGTGTFPNIAAVSISQLVAALGGLTGSVASNSAGALKITSNTTGTSSSVQVTNASTTGAELGFDNAIHAGAASGAVNTLTFAGKTDGTYANAISVLVAASSNGAADHMNLSFVSGGVTLESWPNVSLNQAAADYVVTRLNDPNTGSNLLQVTDLFAAVASPGNLPMTGTFGPLTGGADGLAGLADSDFIGGTSANGDVGLNALDIVDTLSLLAIPGRATPAVQNAMITYANITRAGRVFCILDPPKNQSAAAIVAYVVSTAGLQELSEYGAMYWPNVLVANPSPAVFGTATTLVAPPSGAIAGLMARVDNSTPAGPFVHPAGTVNGLLFNVLGLEMPQVQKKSARDTVFPNLINPITTQTSQGGPIYVDGARTLKDNGNFPTIGERRGVIFVESSGQLALDQARHRNINNRLYNECRRAFFRFLAALTKAEAFASDIPSEAFTVDFGLGLNTPSVAATRTVLGKLSLATSKPAEFIDVLVTPDVRALDAELAAAAQTAT